MVKSYQRKKEAIVTKDEVTKARISDRIDQCRDGYYVTSTDFLDSHEQSMAMGEARSAGGVRVLMYGGYDDAERRMMICIPADLELSDEDASDGLAEVLRITKPAASRELSHRDYLGSMLALGIDRRLAGDILVREDGADIVIMPEIAQFLMREFSRVGRVEIKTELVGIKDLMIPEARFEMISGSVSSPRLDSVISAAFRISRAKAAEAVRSGLVSVDHVECLKPDARVAEGMSLVLKGKGKALLEETGEASRKGRIRIRIKRFI